MSTLNTLLVAVVVILIVSFGAGMLTGKVENGKKIVLLELKWLLKIGRWTLKQTLRVIAEVCQWAHKKL